MHELRELTKQDIKKLNGGHHLTVGSIKEFINRHNLPDDAPVVIQRVQDYYYENCHWGVYLKEGEQAHSLKSFNEDLKNGEYSDIKKYPHLIGETFEPHSEKDIKDAMCQYTPAWSCVRYNDDTDILFIDLHY